MWIVGLAFGLSTGSCNFSQGFDYPRGDKEQNILRDIQNSNQVLGVSTESLAGFMELFKAIPIEIYVIIAIEFILLVIFVLAFFYLGRAWSNASLIIGIDSALKGTKLTLPQISESAIPKVKKLLWLAIVPTLILILVLAILISLSLFLLIAFKIQVLSIIVLAFGLIAIPIFIAISLSLIYAQRSASLEEISAYDSLKRGFSFLRKKLGYTLLVGLINNFIGIIIFAVAALVFIGLFVGGILSLDKSQPLGIFLLVLGGILVAVGILGAFSLTGSILTVFKATVWNQAYEETKKIIDAK